MSDNALVKTTTVMPLAELKTTAALFAESGYFPDAKSIAQAFVKIKTGNEIGIGAMASMTGIAIIQGKPVVGANIIAAKVKMAGYDYIVRRLDTTGCAIEYFNRSGVSIGISTFDENDARSAGLLGKDNWKKYARNMFFARAMSNGQRWYCPDATMGQVLYTPDELGGEVTEDGDPVIKEAEYTVEPPPTQTKYTPPEQPRDVPPQQAAEKTDADKLRDTLMELADKTGKSFRDLLAEYSSFPGKDGGEVHAQSIDKMKLTWIRTTYGKAKDALNKLSGLSEVIDAANGETPPNYTDADIPF